MLYIIVFVFKKLLGELPPKPKSASVPTISLSCRKNYAHNKVFDNMHLNFEDHEHAFIQEKIYSAINPKVKY